MLYASPRVYERGLSVKKLPAPFTFSEFCAHLGFKGPWELYAWVPKPVFPLRNCSACPVHGRQSSPLRCPLAAGPVSKPFHRSSCCDLVKRGIGRWHLARTIWGRKRQDLSWAQLPVNPAKTTHTYLVFWGPAALAWASSSPT